MAANKERKKKSVLFFSLISKNSKLNFDKRFLSRSVFTRFSFFFSFVVKMEIEVSKLLCIFFTNLRHRGDQVKT